MQPTPLKTALAFLAFGAIAFVFWTGARYGDFDFWYNSVMIFVGLSSVVFIIAKIAGVGAQEKTPPSPKEWLEHPAWQGEVVKPDVSDKWLRIGLVAASIVAVPATIGAVWIWRHGDERGLALYLAIVVLCSPALMALNAWLRIRGRSRYRDAQLRLDKIPVHPGSSLTGTFRIPNPNGALRGPLRATLTCRKHLRRNARMATNWSPKELWSQRLQVDISHLTKMQGLLTVPIRFDIPADMPGTRPRIPTSQTGISWILEVSVDARGVDFEDDYRMPVFERTQNAEEAQ